MRLLSQWHTSRIVSQSMFTRLIIFSNNEAASQAFLVVASNKIIIKTPILKKIIVDITPHIEANTAEKKNSVIKLLRLVYHLD